MERRFGAMAPKKVLVIAGSILLWAVALLVLLILFGMGEEPEPEPIFGSLEGRFESDITMTLDGKVLHYRENEITNYLFIGVDKDDVTDVTGHQNGGQADFLVILAIDRINRCITPVMLDRDTMVEMQTYGVFGHPAGTRVMQLCLAQAYSGVNIPGSVNTVETVEKLLCGIDIHHYVVLDMSAIPLVNDALGSRHDQGRYHPPDGPAGRVLRPRPYDGGGRYQCLPYGAAAAVPVRAADPVPHDGQGQSAQAL